MNKLSVGMIFSTIGILIVCLAILNILPGDSSAIKFFYVGIGWVFIIAGSVIRYKSLKGKQ